uniref:Uncharacterized protein n=1 Tax=Oncorhynchus tshawytscha TaxID=74940 RepID=A0AAZ3S6P1_ONCTS
IKFAALALTLLLAQWIALVSPSFYPPLLCTPRMKLSKSFDKLHEYAQTASQTLAPYGDAFSTQFLDTSKQVYQMVMADVEDLHTQLEPKRKKLQQVLQEYVSKRHEDMDTLRAKLQTLVDEMRAKVEETKSKLIPIVEVELTPLQVLKSRDSASPQLCNTLTGSLLATAHYNKNS